MESTSPHKFTLEELLTKVEECLARNPELDQRLRSMNPQELNTKHPVGKALAEIRNRDKRIEEHGNIKSLTPGSALTKAAPGFQDQRPSSCQAFTDAYWSNGGGGGGRGGTGELLKQDNKKTPCPPTAEELMKNSVVVRALNDAWAKTPYVDLSKPHNKGDYRKYVHEEGGWIFWSPSTNKIKTVAAAPGKTPAQTGKDYPDIDLKNPQKPPGDWVLVADFHTHPILNWDLRNGRDNSRSFNNGVPSIIKQGSEVDYVGPLRAGANPYDARHPLPGYPGKELDTRQCR